MPSDERVQRALDALGAARQGFRAALAATHDQMRAYLATHGALARDRDDESRRELGRFAAGRIDAARFADVASESRLLPPAAEAIVRQCTDVLQDVLERDALLFTVEVPAGADMRAAVDAALAEAGRAFGAVLAFQAVKTGVYCAEQHHPLLRAFPYARWNRAERQLGVPLVVRVAGADVRAEALAEYLDGRQRIVLVIDEPCPPAPLARLVSPSILVMQVDEAAKELARLATFDGPAIAAIVPAAAARFVHDPAATPRVAVQHVPATPVRAVGRWSAWQQREQVVHLAALERSAQAPVAEATVTPAAADGASRAAMAPAAIEASPPAAVVASDEESIARVAGWLLAQAGFTDADAGGAA